MNLRARVRSLSHSIRTSKAVITLIRWWTQLPARTRALPAHLLRAITNFQQYGLRQAAALSYYAVFSMFPLILLLAIAINQLVGPTVAQEQIVQGLILFLPEESDTIQLFQDSINQALQQSASFTLVALLGLSWSALGLFSNLSTSLDRIFQAPAVRSPWRQRLLAFAMTLVLILLIGFSFITSGILALVNAFVITSPNVWIRIGILFLPFGLNMLIFVLLFRYVPARRVSWDAVWPAAMIGSVGFEAAKAAFAWYLTSLANFQVVYDSIATVIVLLLWAFLVACIFLLSAEICSQVNLWLLGHDDAARVRIYSETNVTKLPAEIPPPM